MCGFEQEFGRPLGGRLAVSLVVVMSSWLGGCLDWATPPAVSLLDAATETSPEVLGDLVGDGVEDAQAPDALPDGDVVDTEEDSDGPDGEGLTELDVEAETDVPAELPVDGDGDVDVGIDGDIDQDLPFDAEVDAPEDIEADDVGVPDAPEDIDADLADEGPEIDVPAETAVDIDATSDGELDTTDIDTDTDTDTVEPIGPVITAHRTSGIAPLYVFFDATASELPGVADLDHCHFLWEFGSSNEVWATTGTLKEQLQGKYAAHVFDQAGVHSVKMRPVCPDGALAEVSVDITVTAPVDAFPGQQTLCLSTDSDFTGCPLDAMQENPNSGGLAGVLASVSSFDFPIRVLLARGQSFAMGGYYGITATAPRHISAFGEGADPILDASSGALQMVASEADVVIDSVTFLGGSEAVLQASDGGQLLLYRVTTENVTLPFNLADFFSSKMPSAMGIVGCDISAPEAQINLMGHNVAIIGTLMTSNDQTSAWLLGGDRFVVASNRLEAPASTNATVLAVGGSPAICASGGTVTQNLLTGGQGYRSVSIGVVYGGSAECASDITVETNWFKSNGPQNTKRLLALSGDDILVRNNLFDLNNAVSGVAVHDDWVTSSGVVLAHNTVWTEAMAVDDGILPLWLQPGVEGVTVVNNAVVALGWGSTNVVAVVDEGSGNTLSGNALESFFDPFEPGPLQVPDDFVLSSSSPTALRNAAPPTVWATMDLFGMCRFGVELVDLGLAEEPGTICAP